MRSASDPDRSHQVGPVVFSSHVGIVAREADYRHDCAPSLRYRCEQYDYVGDTEDGAREYRNRLRGPVLFSNHSGLVAQLEDYDHHRDRELRYDGVIYEYVGDTEDGAREYRDQRRP